MEAPTRRIFLVVGWSGSIVFSVSPRREAWKAAADARLSSARWGGDGLPEGTGERGLSLIAGCPIRKKEMRLHLLGGMDETRTRDLLRDRQAF